MVVLLGEYMVGLILSMSLLRITPMMVRIIAEIMTMAAMIKHLMDIF